MWKIHEHLFERNHEAGHDQTVTPSPPLSTYDVKLSHRSKLQIYPLQDNKKLVTLLPLKISQITLKSSILSVPSSFSTYSLNYSLSNESLSLILDVDCYYSKVNNSLCGWILMAILERLRRGFSGLMFFLHEEFFASLCFSPFFINLLNLNNTFFYLFNLKISQCFEFSFHVKLNEH